MTDLIVRLRQAHLYSSILRGSSLLCKEAADELERLTPTDDEKEKKAELLAEIGSPDIATVRGNQAWINDAAALLRKYVLREKT